MDFDDIPPVSNARVLKFAPKSARISYSATKITKIVKRSKIETKDRLNDLSDCVIIHILSFLNAKQAVQTCILSSRWKNMWKVLPELKLHYDSTDFGTCKIFANFVHKVLSLRDSSFSLQAIDVRHDTDVLEPSVLKRIVNYAISHNVPQLGLCIMGDIEQIPNRMFSCETITQLKLSIYPKGYHETPFLESLNLPALTSLQLENFEFCARDNDRAEPFSSINRLNSLFISNCTVSHAGCLCISSVMLVNLTMYNEFPNFYIIELCTPSLCTFAFNGTPFQKLIGSDVSSLKHVEIYTEEISYQKEAPLFLFSWLLEFPNIKSLTVSATTLQVLYFIPDLFKIKSPSFGNLELLKVKMEPFSYKFHQILDDVMLQKAKSKKEAAKIRREFKDRLAPPSFIPNGITDFLLRNSPLAKLHFIAYSRQPFRPTHL